MSSVIRILDEQTINKIAAGEVIENPASVVKELVENSVDAGADDICVEIKEGGRQLIRITDNGCGMTSDDALLSLERHATSKVREIEDVHSVVTMGFRGEAVPSIASISKFTLLTCKQGNDLEEGTMVIVDGGNVLKCCPAARSPGTTVEVKSLFFNVPVRKKFQRSPNYDINEILKMLSVLALGNPSIKFQLISNNKTLLSVSIPQGEDKLGERVASVMGNEYFESLLPLEFVKGEYQLKGFIGCPTYNRQNRTGQYLFINGRPVFSSLISHWIREAYGTSLASNRHPVFVLYLTMPHEWVDVNVHPQKREVRLRQSQQLKETIFEGVDRALQGSIMNFSEDVAVVPERSPAPFPSYFMRPENIVRDPLPPLPALESAPPRDETQQFFPTPPPKRSSIRVLTTIDNYIVVDPATIEGSKIQQGLCLVDQRAAQSLIIFEQLMRQDHNSAIQPLLIPYTLEVTPLESAWLREHLDDLNIMGIEIKNFGQTTFIVHALPQVFGNADIKVFLTNLVQNMRDHQDEDPLHQEQKKRIAVAASHSSKSLSKRLSCEQAQALVIELMRCENPSRCPQGRTTLIHLGPEEIAKYFQKGTTCNTRSD